MQLYCHSLFFSTLGIFQSVHCLASQFDMVYSQEIGYLLLFDNKDKVSFSLIHKEFFFLVANGQ